MNNVHEKKSGNPDSVDSADADTGRDEGPDDTAAGGTRAGGAPTARTAQKRADLARRAMALGREILETEGMRALTARRLSKALGCAIGTIYNLFADMDQLVVRLNVETLQELESELASRAATDAGKPARDRLTGLAETYIGFTASHPARWAAVIEAGAASPDTEREAMIATVESLVAPIEDALIPLLDRDRAAPEIRRTAVALWTGIEGIGRLAISDNLALIAPGTDAATLMREQINRFVDGLEAAATQSDRSAGNRKS